MSFLSRSFLVLGLLWVGGCSVLFGILGNRDECTKSQCIDNNQTSLFCSQGELFAISCGQNGCDPNSGECNFRCGDGFTQPENSEDCEPSVDEDCTLTCRHIAHCSNGQIEPPEECDDGNTQDNDGCNAQCRLEITPETEPNEDGSIAPNPKNNSLGNDFSIENANGPFTGDVLLSGLISPVGDEDVFSFTNVENRARSVRLDIFDARFGFRTLCNSLPIGPDLNIWEADGTFVIQGISRSHDNIVDVCPGTTVSLGPGQTLYAHVLFNFDTPTDLAYLLYINFDAETPDCGDGIFDPALEECDPFGEFCQNNCRHESFCGDNFKDLAEECEDNNRASGDGCSKDCQIEAGFACDGEPSVCRLVVCGDGIADIQEPDPFTDPPERCDDGNTQGGDGCAADCQSLEPGFLCEVEPGEPSVCHPLVCGDGLINAPERCDDSNPIDADGCSSLCEFESGFVCAAGEPTVCRPIVCGDGVLDLPESCDDSNTLGGDACPSDCAPFTLPIEREPNDDGSPSQTPGTNGGDFSVVNAEGPFTADTLLVATINPIGDEDIFSVQNDTAVAAEIRVDIFDPASGVGAPCVEGIHPVLNLKSSAGNIIRQSLVREVFLDTCPGLDSLLLPGETTFVQALDFNDNSLVKPYLLQIKITPIVCGDGIVTFAEGCDDGNTTDSDGCASFCDVETDFSCQGEPSSCHPVVCGDDLVDFGEECDDGNAQGGDGCSFDCRLEVSGFICGSGETLLQVTATDVPKNIPDDNATGVVSTLNISDTRTVKRVIVRIDDLTHTFDGDLFILLSSPSNTEVHLLDPLGIDGDNFINTIFDDGCFDINNPFPLGTPPYTDCFSPFGLLHEFHNEAANGDWKLKLIDIAAPDTGTLNAWTLGLCVQ